MKKLAIPLVVLYLGLASPARAEICLDVCSARIMPDVPSAHLPLLGWIYSGTQNQSVTVLEPPQFGTWEVATESYKADPLFWSTGIDRMKVQINGNPNDTRTLVFLTANPTIYQEVETYDPPEVLTAASPNAALAISGKTNGVATVGGYVNASAEPPPINNLPGALTQTTLLQLGELAHVTLVSSQENGVGISARADFVPLGCGTACDTAILPVTYGETYEITLTLGFDSIEVPTANSLTLRLEVCENDRVYCQSTELPGLAVVNLSNAINLEVGILGGTTTNASQTVHQVVLWQSLVGPTTETTTFETFTGGQQSFWGQQGPIAATPTTNLSWAAEANLTNLDSTTRAWFLDARPALDKRLRLLLDLDISQLSLGEGDFFFLVHGQGLVVNGIGKTLDVLVRKLNGVYILRGRVIDDSGATLLLPAHSLNPNKVNTVALHFVAATQPGMKGSLFVAVNGVGQHLGSIDNDQRVLESVNFGVSTFTTSGNSNWMERLLRFDNLTLVY